MRASSAGGLAAGAAAETAIATAGAAGLLSVSASTALGVGASSAGGLAAAAAAGTAISTAGAAGLLSVSASAALGLGVSMMLAAGGKTFTGWAGLAGLSPGAGSGGMGSIMCGSGSAALAAAFSSGAGGEAKISSAAWLVIGAAPSATVEAGLAGAGALALTWTAMAA